MLSINTFLIVLVVTVLASRLAHQKNYTPTCIVAGLGWALLIMDVLEKVV